MFDNHILLVVLNKRFFNKKYFFCNLSFLTWLQCLILSMEKCVVFCLLKAARVQSVRSVHKTGVNVNSVNNICVEINERIVSGNKCFFRKLLKFKLSSRKSKILYGTKVTLDLS